MAKSTKGRRPFGSTRRLPSGRWQASYWWQGERHTAPQTWMSKGDASAWLAGQEDAIRRGAWSDPSAGQITVGQWATRWLEQRTDLRPRTRSLYELLLRRHILPVFGSKHLPSVRPTQVASWRAELADSVPTTAAKAYRLLSELFAAAIRMGLVASNPCQVRGGGREHAPERPVASVAEVQALADAMPERFRLVVLLAAWCQLRRGELLGLQRQDVDTAGGVLDVERTRAVVGVGQLIGLPKTDAGRRAVAVPPNILPDLASHLALFVSPAPDAWLFVGEKGGPVTPGVLYDAWAEARQKVGRADLRLHDLRHAGLTWAAATGASVAELMRRGGHSSSAAAMRYQHATADRDRALAVALAELAVQAKPVPFAHESRTPRATQDNDSAIHTA